MGKVKDYKFSSSTILSASHQIMHYNNVLYNEYCRINDVVKGLKNSWQSNICDYTIDSFNVTNEVNLDRFKVVDNQCKFLCDAVNSTYTNAEVKFQEVLTDSILKKYNKI